MSRELRQSTASKLKILAFIAFISIFCLSHRLAAQVSIATANVTGVIGKQVIVPVRVSNFRIIRSAQASFNFDTSVVRYAGIEQFAFSNLSLADFDTSNVQAGKIGFSWVASQPSGETLGNNSVLFALVFNLKGVSGASTPIEITDNPSPVLFADSLFNAVSAITSSGVVSVPESYISIDTIDGSRLCIGAPIVIPFSPVGFFDINTEYTAQLSDVTGSFAKPINLGSATKNRIVGTIPDIVKPGTFYRIRVVASTNVSAVSFDNGYDLAINMTPSAPIASGAERCGPGILALNASKNTGTASFKWYAGLSGDSVISGITNTLTTPFLTDSTFYRVSLVNQFGCEGPQVKLIAAIKPIPMVSLGRNDTVCVNATPFKVGNYSPVGGVWQGLGIDSTGLFTPASVGTGSFLLNYMVNVSGCSSTASKRAVVLPAPSFKVSVTNTTCGNATGSAEVDLTGNFVYSWNNGLSGRSVNNLAGGIYQVTVIDTMNGCSASETAIIQNSDVPVVAFTGLTTCADTAGMNLNGTPAGGIFSGTGIINNRFWPSIAGPGKHVITYTVNNNGCSNTALDTIFVNPIPTIPLVSVQGNLIFCAGDSVTLNGPGGAAKYIWSNGDTTQSIRVKQTANLHLRVRNNLGCVSMASDTINVQTNPLPDMPTINVSSANICFGDSAILTAPAGFIGYNWSNGASGQRLAVRQTGTFTVVVSNANGCISPVSQPVSVQANPIPAQPVINATAASICAGDSVILTAPAGFPEYSWSNGKTTQSIAVRTENTYTVRIKDSFGCISPVSQPAFLRVNPIPAAPAITANGPLSFCQGHSVSLTAADGYTEYSWSNGGTTRTLGITQGGQYTVRGKAGGCLSLPSQVISVTVNPIPAKPVINSRDTAICNGSSLALEASGGFVRYAWSNGDTARTTTIKQSGKYVVSGIDANRCFSPVSDTVKVNVLPTPQRPVITRVGNDSLRANVQASSFVWIRNDSLLSGQSTATIATGAEGQYKVIALTGNCSSDTSAAFNFQRVSINKKIGGMSIAVYPNPSNGLFIIDAAALGQATIADAMGRIIWQQKIAQGETTVDLSARVSGVYHLLINTANGSAIRKLVLK